MDRPPKIRTVDSDNELQQAARRYTRLFIVILTFAAQPGLCSVRRAGRGVTLLAVALLAWAGPGAGISAQAATQTPGYVITLESSRRGIRPEALDAVSKVPNRVAYITRATVNDVAWERLKLGFFASEEEANQILAGLKREFPQAWVGTAMPEDLDHYRVHTAVASSARLEPKIPATVEPKVTAKVEPKIPATVEPKVTAKVEP
ncbi:MAG: hypothetical protein MUP90_17335, partial [Gammaproteobacteria bacterium]|nr:hypothetical protein [Gammaproteobacteria bacterium]